MPDHPNFLDSHHAPLPPTEERQPSASAPKRRWVRWAIWLVLALVLASLVPLIYGGVTAGLAAYQLKTKISDTVAKAQARDFNGALASLEGTDALAQQIRDGLRATGFWRGMPYIGTQLQALEDVSLAGASGIEGARAILRVAASLEDALSAVGVAAPGLQTGVEPTRSFHDLSAEEKRSILARFADALPDLRIAREKVDIAADAWSRVPQNELAGPLRNALAPIAQLLPDFRSRLDHAVSLIEVFVPMAGYPTPKRYLVLLQNSDELRATGGFIGNVGLLEVNAGDLGKLVFSDVYSFDGPSVGKLHDAPPEILKRELGTTAWYLRDSNWSPDFPQSSERLLDVFTREAAFAGVSTTQPGGVIALNPKFFTDLLHLTGPLSVSGKSFNESNFFDELQYDVEQGFLYNGTPISQRKEIVAAVGQALVQKLMDLPASQWPQLLEIVNTALGRKDIQIYDRDPSLLTLLDARNWSGRVRGADQDYLLVVDSNLAAFKTDGVMDKQIRYTIDATDPQGPLATVTLTYTNNAPGFTWRYTRYRDYVRVYAPEGSEFVTSTGAMLMDKHEAGGRVIPGPTDVFHDLGKTGFGAFWSVEPHETRALSFTYRLPSSISVSESYKLLVQRQSGSNTTLTLDSKFAKNVTSADPPEDPKDFGDNRYQASFDLTQDRNVNVTLSP